MTTPSTKRSNKGLFTFLACACASSFMLASAHAQSASPITTVFYVLLENRCLTSGTDTSQFNILFQNKLGASPYTTALGTPGSTAYTFNYQGNTIPVNAHTSFCTCYHHDFATYNGTNVTPYFVGTDTANQPQGQSVHPSEPNYVFMEAGSNLNVLSDNEPYASSGPSMTTIANFLTAHPSFSGENLSALLQNAGISWTSYTEGTCLLNTAGQDFNSLRTGSLTNNVAPLGLRTVPTTSFSGTQSSYTNSWNGTHQFNFATKHTGQLFFTATNGGTVTAANVAPTNSAVEHYEALESLTADLANNTQAAYCVITPDQYNDGHTALSTPFVYNGITYGSNQGSQGGATGTDLERVAQMDSFSAQIVSQILASPVYQAGHAAIVLWTDETEGSPQNDFYHTLEEIVISPYCKSTQQTPSPTTYLSTVNYTHSSDVATMQEIFGVTGNTATGFLNDAANPSIATPGTVPGGVTVNTGQGLQNSTGQPFWGFGTATAQDFADLFVPGVIPTLPTVTVTASGYAVNARTHTVTQTVTLTNPLSATTANPVYLVLGNLSSNTSLVSATPSATTGTTTSKFPGSPYILAAPGGLASGASVTYTLKFAYPSSGTISDTLTAVTSATAP